MAVLLPLAVEKNLSAQQQVTVWTQARMGCGTGANAPEAIAAATNDGKLETIGDILAEVAAREAQGCDWLTLRWKVFFTGVQPQPDGSKKATVVVRARLTFICPNENENDEVPTTETDIN